MKAKTIFTFLIILICIPVFSFAIEKWDGKITTIVIGNKQPLIQPQVRPPNPVSIDEPQTLDELHKALGISHKPETPFGFASVTNDPANIVSPPDPDNIIPGIHCYDTNEGYLGLLVSTQSSTITLYLPDVETMIRLNVGDGTLLSGSLYFESIDCTGDALSIASASSYEVTKVCNKFYTGKRIEPKFTSVHSYMLVHNNSCQCFDIPTDRSGYYVPAISIPSDLFGFSMPIQLPLRFRAWNRPID